MLRWGLAWPLLGEGEVAPRGWWAWVEWVACVAWVRGGRCDRRRDASRMARRAAHSHSLASIKAETRAGGRAWG